MSLTPTPASGEPRPTGGIDWAWDEHAVSVVDPHGHGERDRFAVRHDAAGLRELVRRLLRAGVGEVGIERPDGPVVDALLQAGLTVFVVHPNQVKSLRGRYGSAGNKDDHFDAFVLADTVRTDHARLRPLVADQPPTLTLRMLTRTRKDLVAHRIALTNQLRAHLQIVFPGAVGLFHDLDSPISLRFLARFTTQDQADWLSVTRMQAWLTANGYCGRQSATTLHAHLAGAPRGSTGADGAARAHITRALLTALTAMSTQIRELETAIAEALRLHPDGPLFTSLPRAGTLRAARLLAEIGDCRARFPTADSLACLAGVAPSTRRSGKHHAVAFRWAADKQLRDALTDFAGDSRRANLWAARTYDRHKQAGKDHAHITRILARSWSQIIWRCWQDRIPYDPNRHRALQAAQHPAA